MWMVENRRAYERSGLRYLSDLTDAEWALVEPLILPAKHGGRKRTVDVREVVNGIFYVLSTGCQWRALPKDLPPRSTVHEYLQLWDGTALWPACTMRSTCKPASWPARKPARVLRSSTARVSRARKRGSRIDPSGYDAGKKVKGKCPQGTLSVKRHILVDTLGLILVAHVHPASIQDRDGALPLLKEARRLFPFIERLFADGGYQGSATAAAVQALGAWRLEVVCPQGTQSVKRSDQAKGFVVLPKRWIVERAFARLGRCRRLAKAFETLSRTALAFLRLAFIQLMLRRIARASAQT